LQQANIANFLKRWLLVAIQKTGKPSSTHQVPSSITLTHPQHDFARPSWHLQEFFQVGDTLAVHLRLLAILVALFELPPPLWRGVPR
jgi:hypothetical protein